MDHSHRAAVACSPAAIDSTLLIALKNFDKNQQIWLRFAKMRLSQNILSVV
jgi:hypothetical protein